MQKSVLLFLAAALLFAASPGALRGQTEADKELAALARMASLLETTDREITIGGAEAASRKIFKVGDACELDGILSIEGKGDESWFALTVNTPIPILSEEGGNPMSTKLFQIAGLDESGWKNARKLAGKSVRIRGRLMEAHTRYHRTPFLINADRLQPR